MTGAVEGSVRRWLRLEGALTLVAAAYLYDQSGYSWMLFAALFLVPDASFAGYLAGPRVGAVIYNVVHSHVGPLASGVAALTTGTPVMLPLIWAAHVGFDRAMGYGLKYPTAFGDTHLGRIGRIQPATPTSASSET